jgi:hypothetical protein
MDVAQVPRCSSSGLVTASLTDSARVLQGAVPDDFCSTWRPFNGRGANGNLSISALFESAVFHPKNLCNKNLGFRQPRTHFFSDDAQLRIMSTGGAFICSAFSLIRKRCPSTETS